MEPERIEVSPPQRPVFSREQKVGYAVVVGCGALAVVLGLLYVGRHLNAPFAISYTGSHILNADEQEARQIAEQKRSDTDGDTISDYDELYVYESSPYLTDTDSDGLSDDVEITSDSDPTCAVGDSCTDEADDLNLDISINPEYEAQAQADAAQVAAAMEAMKETLANIPPSEIRAMLIQSGADPSEVDAMTDEEVSALYQEILTQLETSGQLDALLQGSSQTPTP